jgi:hypothetical protein
LNLSLSSSLSKSKDGRRIPKPARDAARVFPFPFLPPYGEGEPPLFTGPLRPRATAGSGREKIQKIKNRLSQRSQRTQREKTKKINTYGKKGVK